MRDDSAEIFFQSFMQEALVSSSGMGRDVHSLMMSIHHFLLPSTASPILLGALKDGLGEAVVACDTPAPSKFPFLDSCQKSFCGHSHCCSDCSSGRVMYLIGPPSTSFPLSLRVVCFSVGIIKNLWGKENFPPPKKKKKRKKEKKSRENVLLLT